MRAIHRAALAAIGLVAAVSAAPALAQATAAAATGVNQASPEVFVQTLADQTFAVLKADDMSETARRERFEAMVRQHFAIRTLGDRLIRRHRASITTEQYSAYVETLPDFIVGTYAARLEPYANASFQVIRSMPRGAKGEADVITRVSKPGQTKPFSATWSLTKDTAGRYRIANLTVEGVNLALSQEADFSALIERQGFDSLVAFMRSKAKSG